LAHEAANMSPGITKKSAKPLQNRFVIILPPLKQKLNSQILETRKKVKCSNSTIS